MKQEDHRHEDGYREDDNARSSSGSVPKVYYCINCDIAFFWAPVIVDEKVYCCTGCADGGPCCCDYSQYSSVTISGVIHYGLDEEALKEFSDWKTS